MRILTFLIVLALVAVLFGFASHDPILAFAGQFGAFMIVLLAPVALVAVFNGRGRPKPPSH